MRIFDIGKIKVQISPEKIVFGDGADPNRSVSISSRSLPLVIGYLRSFLSNQHQFFRIPIGQRKLQVGIKYGGTGLQQVEPINLSLSSILVKSSQLQQKVYVHAIVGVLLEYDYEKASLLGEVRWMDEDRIGIEFLKTKFDGDQILAPEHASICRKLEVEWFSEALRIDKVDTDG